MAYIVQVCVGGQTATKMHFCFAQISFKLAACPHLHPISKFFVLQYRITLCISVCACIRVCVCGEGISCLISMTELAIQTVQELRGPFTGSQVFCPL